MKPPIYFWSNRIGFHIGKDLHVNSPVLMHKRLNLIFQHHFHNTSNSYMKKEYSDIPNPNWYSETPETQFMLYSLILDWKPTPNDYVKETSIEGGLSSELCSTITDNQHNCEKDICNISFSPEMFATYPLFL